VNSLRYGFRRISFFDSQVRSAGAEDAQGSSGQGRREGVCSAREAERAGGRNLVPLRRERSRSIRRDRKRTLAGVVLSAAFALLLVGATASSAEAAFGFLPGTPGFDATALNADGSTDTQAGSHPFEASTVFSLNTTQLVKAGGVEESIPDQDLKDASVSLPPGLIGSATAVPQCPIALFTTPNPGSGVNSGSCPASSAVGVAAVHLPGARYVSLYNLVPPPGVPAEFGFNVTSVPITLVPKVRTGGDYGLDVEALAANQDLRLYGVKVTLWGVPASESHDGERGLCLNSIFGGSTLNEETGLPNRCPYVRRPGETTPKPFLTLPTSCLGPVTTSITADSWQEPGPFDADGNPLLTDPRWKTDSVLSHDTSGNPVGNDGCNQVPFEPTISAKPTTDLADSPSGLEFDLHFPQRKAEENPEGLAQADLKDATVTLPQGLTVNPSSANGLAACSESQVGFLGPNPEGGGYRFTPHAAECPDASKLGMVEIDTSILESPLPGAVYLAAQNQNPFGSLLALYLTVDDPKTGIVVKLPGRVSPDPSTGQLTATFSENPQLPFEDLKVSFFGGALGALRTPATCGGYMTTTDLTPWTTPEGVDAHPADSFQVDRSASGGSCPTTLPNQPAFDAGTLSPTAGAYAPFLLKLTRSDDSQEISAIDTTLPAGLTGKLAGIPYCPESGLATAAARNKPGDGALEQSSPSCPAASQVGTVTVGAGAGPTPFYATGKAYLAGPYKGAPLSLAVITPAIAGPFDLGDVLVRTALYVEPESARIHAVSDPFPSILQGIPLDIRSIALNMNRSGFTLNPTSCEKMSVLGTSTSVLGQMAGLTSPFQVGECSKLAFRPSLKISLTGQTRRAGHPALKAVLTYPKGGAYANVARAQVSLPGSEFLDQGNLNKVCTQPELKSQSCPAKSIYGKVKAWTPLLEKPLEGNVYLAVGFGYKLPALVAELDGQIRVLLKGKVDTDSHKGIRNTFEAVPDAPVERFVLEMKGGKKYGLLENSENICSKPQKAEAAFTAQNGAVDSYGVKIANSCGKKSKGKKKSGSRGPKGKKHPKGHGRH
jgi:hypothetical protein